MRLLDFTILLLLSMTTACGSRSNLDCLKDSSCDLAVGGVCSDPGTGTRWCAYPDGNCPSGYRYSTVQVGDGVAGMCVAAELKDAGVDTPDSRVDTGPPMGWALAFG